MEIDLEHFQVHLLGVVAVNACRTAPEGSAGRLLSLLDQLRLPDAGALPDWGLHPGMLLGTAREQETGGQETGKQEDRQETGEQEETGGQGEDNGDKWVVNLSGVSLSDDEVPAETLVGLQNLLVHLRDVSAENAHVYQYRLWDAKRVKVETAQNRVCNTDGNTSRNAGGYTGRKID
ncbi:hypothetical protein FJT64_018449 [Amphibalanus amphitrite]|uniref:Uncharacterized protein n=1 Tax=Amphibalanus amphitrite TaxID=1232801 RepID=A0A6A4WXI0_AMPAM|nr:hypothetical protein FJT64_018449 [Amphibalanus amphitrite]